MKILLIILAVIAGIIAIVMIAGAALPKNHSVSRAATFKRDRRSVYEVVRNVSAAPQWREGVQKIEVLDDKHFREHSKTGVVTYEIVEDKPPQTFITRIADKNLGYSGSWTHQFDETPEGTRLTITENGEVSNVLFRFMSRFVFGHTASIDAYLKSLERKLTSNDRAVAERAISR